MGVTLAGDDGEILRVNWWNGGRQSACCCELASSTLRRLIGRRTPPAERVFPSAKHALSPHSWTTTSKGSRRMLA